MRLTSRSIAPLAALLIGLPVACKSKPSTSSSTSSSTSTSSEPGALAPAGGDAASARAPDDVDKLDGSRKLGTEPVRRQNEPGIKVEPSGFLLVPKSRLSAIRRGKSPAWKRLESNVRPQLGGPRGYRTSIENVAVAYLVTEEKRYAETAIAWAVDSVDKDDIRRSNYLYIAEVLRPIAMVLNYCAPVLDDATEKKLADHLYASVDELWNHNKGHGWGLADPGSNFHMAFLEATAFAGYALDAAKDARGKELIKILKDRLFGPKGVLEYLETRARGGAFSEGTNYGQRSKQRLYNTLSVMVSMGEDNLFQSHPFFADSILFAIYQMQPGRGVLNPVGDLPRETTMAVTPYDRDYIQMATFWMGDSEARAHGQWILKKVVPSYATRALNWRGAYYKDVLFEIDAPEKNDARLPTMYHAEGSGLINMRSDWGGDATSLNISAPTIIDQDHAHFDAGSFTLWKRDWMIADAATYSRNGLLWQGDAHSGISIGKNERRYGKVGGVLALVDDDRLGYAQVDASSLYRKRNGTKYPTVLREFTREFVFLKPNTLVVYDRVEAKGRQKYDWRVHFAVEPALEDGIYKLSHGGGSLAMAVLKGEKLELESDRDIDAKSWRLTARSKRDPGRFLSVFEVAAGAPPALSTELVAAGSGVEGARVGKQVVLFSTAARGARVEPAFSYTVSGTGKMTHVLVNMKSGCDADVAQKDGKTEVTIRPGSTFPVSAEGVIRFTL